MRPEMKAIADGVIEIVKGYVAEAKASLVGRIKEIDARIDALPVYDSEKVVADAVAKAMADLPHPKDGASVILDDVRPMIEQEVTKAVAAVPIPKDGQSVSAEDVAPMVAEQVAKAVSAIPAPKDGASVPVEDVRRMVDEAVTKAVAAVQLPKDGEPGRDAAQLEILPGIDVARSYARGTYAKHAGGLWRSYEATTGMKGWECIVEGIAHFSIEQQPENPRKFFMNLTTSSGFQQIKKEFNLPVVLYRGIFKEGDDYEAGDSVTWGGSTWIALQDTKSKPDSADGTWRLSVKRGSPGKDAGK